MSEAYGASKIAALLLTAGLSSRAGPRNKLLVNIPGQATDYPIVRSSAENLLASQAHPVIVVTGHERKEVESALAGLDLKFVYNPDFATGMSSSLVRGLHAIPDVARGVIVALGDMPMVSTATINILIAKFLGSDDKTICVPVHDGRRGNPVLFSRVHFAKLTELAGDAGGKTILEANPNALAEVIVNDPGIHLDFDNP